MDTAEQTPTTDAPTRMAEVTLVLNRNVRKHTHATATIPESMLADRTYFHEDANPTPEGVKWVAENGYETKAQYDEPAEDDEDAQWDVDVAEVTVLDHVEVIATVQRQVTETLHADVPRAILGDREFFIDGQPTAVGASWLRANGSSRQLPVPFNPAVRVTHVDGQEV